MASCGRQIVHLVRLVADLVGTESAPESQDSAGTAAAPGESARLRILVADDNADGADSLAMLLQAEGHVVLTAPDGRRAVEVAEVFSPDVILMDVAMPGLSGIEATREIRSRPWGPANPHHRVDGLGPGG